ncbi:YaeQ family protein [Shewanella sp. FJAT-52076]|uniref:YaeQ family protein n=1 Tax=Shewanella sp. FJAT-52076 TaxID=2864202 RepID=UPI001C65AB00|nr:YaeQ family protein [Shewanella sp. FJAT-52076]QYJ73981.1 YaeQ family protein [Shewanella sp. FJAT-52076]
MTLKSDVHKVSFEIADLRRGYFGYHKLTLARHPSETEQRLMLRLLAFALYASAGLKFVGELCNQDEPELCEQALDGHYLLWAEFGLADERRIKRAVHRADKVVVFAYGGQDLAHWWDDMAGKCARIDSLSVLAFDNPGLEVLLPFVAKTMTLAVNIDEEGNVRVSNGEYDVVIVPRSLK